MDQQTNKDIHLCYSLDQMLICNEGIFSLEIKICETDETSKGLSQRFYAS